MIISFLSQRGGVGKSSLARTVAVEFTQAGWRTLLADIDSSQATSNRWAEQRRTQAAIKPEVCTQVFATTHQALTEAKFYDLLIIDGRKRILSDIPKKRSCSAMQKLQITVLS